MPCRTTSALGDRAYSAVGLAGSALHIMVVLQVFQAKLLRAMDEFGLDPASFKELRSTTDLVLLSTKMTSQAIGRLMASLVVLEVGPPSKKSRICLPTPHSALGIGGTVPTVLLFATKLPSVPVAANCCPKDSDPFPPPASGAGSHPGHVRLDSADYKTGIIALEVWFTVQFMTKTLIFSAPKCSAC